ncbi:VanZ family protein [Corynebacterium diphtheriae]|nr:VanZ family protein [Corynebacterium diphtheriae]CAB0673267.1 VanZ family protein [Corynebacterium diphtheriae]CAB0890438.1 VanZ family protein [Corynebacterium diphtheriae]CAB0981066.1 VanZ family protein [Corynebacterium diphtheriae]
MISVLIELSQYAFSLGFSDIDDVITNALGALIGAVIAKICGPKMFPVWASCAILLGVVFAVLVGLGERLGDPSRIAPS